MNKTDLAYSIYQSGNHCSVPAIHASFSDCSWDEGGFPFSKIASDLMDEMHSAGISKTINDNMDYIEIEKSAIEMIKTFAPLTKVAIDENFIEKLKFLTEKFAESMMPEMDVPDVPEPFERGEQVIQAATVEPPKPKFDRDAEMQMLSNWKKTNDPKHMRDLLKSYEPLINKHANIYMHSNLRPSVIKAEAQRVAMTAFDNYDPKKGVQLNTFVTSYMPKIGRFVNEHSNVVRIPEEWKMKISNFQERESELESKLKRPPTSSELSDELNWHIDDVAKMRRFLRKDLIAEANEGGSSLARMKTPEEQKTKDFLDMLYLELAGKEKLVFEHIFGLHGHKQVETSDEIAQKTKMQPHEVYAARQKIADLYQKFAWQA